MKYVSVMAVMMAVTGVRAMAAETAYPVSGTVVDISETAIVVKKGRETWTINRDSDTRIKGEVRKGGKVTVRYTMTATSIESKDDAKAGDRKKDAGKEEKK